MKLFSTLLLVLVVLLLSVESAKRCYSGSKDRFESRQCDTGTAGNFVCQKFTCEGGKLDSNFTVRACAPEGSRCESSSTVCADQDGVGYCSICEEDNCNSAGDVIKKSTIFVIFLAAIRIF